MMNNLGSNNNNSVLFVLLMILMLVDMGIAFASTNEECAASITQYQQQTYNDGSHDYSIWDVNVYSQGSHTINNLTLKIVPPQTHHPIIKTWGINFQRQGKFRLPSFSTIKIGSMYNFGYLIAGTQKASISIDELSCNLPLLKACNVTLSPLVPVEIKNNEVDEESVYLLYRLNFTNIGENAVSKVFIQVAFPDFSSLTQFFGMEKTCCTQIKSEATFEVPLFTLEKDKNYDGLGFVLHFSTRHSKFDTHPDVILTGIECENS